MSLNVLVLGVNGFIGNLEGREFHKGAADVVVCDGFVGNVLLKYSEGVFAYILRAVQQEL